MMRLTPYGGQLAPLKALLHRLYDRGVIAFFCGHGPYHLRLLPPVGVLQPADVEAFLEQIELALEDA